MNQILNMTRAVHAARGHFRTTFRTFAPLIGACMLGATSATAATISYSFLGTGPDAHPVSASADFTAEDDGNTLTVKLTNSTAPTLHAGGLLTGLEFSVAGTPMLTSATGIERTIDGDGISSDDTMPEELSWSLVSLGGDVWQLNFNPNAEHAIVGPPSIDSYAGANGSIRGNPGHNPFAAEMAVFNVAGIEGGLSSVVVQRFLFGTDLRGGTVIPEPAALLLTLLGGAFIGLLRPRR